ncbi:MAG TPA: TonB-dependent receptor [Candidatus Polarisedimenticolia bacterium]|nr:TonB-dependent receptor [Candidatus Polarisedimenticolia bacterium]
MVFHRQSVLLPIALVAVLSAATTQTQSADTTLRGVVRDAAKAPIAGAVVTATNQATKATESATTGADGGYSLSLAPGTYSVTATASGFWEQTRSVELAAGGPNQLDLLLKPTPTEVVTVTAMKRETAQIDVPFSVVALTEQELRDRGAENLEGVAANVGSFTVQNLGPGQSQVAMRGVSSGQITRDQPGVKEQVGIYLDESPVSLSLFTPDLDLVDVNHVEVLRGPQGTLFGAGSVTGTVRYVTNQPALGVTDGFVEGGPSLASDGTWAGDIKAGVNVPLGDKTAARFVGYYTHLAGYTDDIQPNLSVNDDVNDGYRSGGRAAVTIAPNDKLSITPRVVFQRVKTNGWNREDIYNILANPFTTSRPTVDFEDREEFTQLQEEYTDDFELADLNVRYDFGPVVLTSVSSYLYRDIDLVRDTTALTASFTGGTFGMPEPVYSLDSPLFDATEMHMGTQELRLSGEQKRWQWLTGAFYSHAKRDYGQNVSVPGFTAMTNIPTKGILAPTDSLYFSDLSYELDQFALFGEATVSLTDHFSVTAGLRYYDFSEDKTAFVDGFVNNPDLGNSVLSQPGSTDANGFAPRLIGTYKLSDNMIFNAQVSRGFRLGGINDPLNLALCTGNDPTSFGGHETWQDEKVWNYEIGYKSRLLGGKASFDASVFYIDISDLQTTVTAGTCTSRIILNVPDAHSQGLEVDFKAAPSRHFNFSVSGSFNDAKLDSTIIAPDPNGVELVVAGIKDGRRLPSVPQVQAAATATYQFEVLNSSQMYFTGTYQHVGSRFTQVGDEDLGTLDLNSLPFTIGGPLTQSTFSYDPELPAYDILNLRAGLRRADWEVSAYVNNVTDELALLSFDRERGTLARIGYVTNQPRTFGISTRFNF